MWRSQLCRRNSSLFCSFLYQTLVHLADCELVLWWIFTHQLFICSGVGQTAHLLSRFSYTYLDPSCVLLITNNSIGKLRTTSWHRLQMIRLRVPGANSNCVCASPPDPLNSLSCSFFPSLCFIYLSFVCVCALCILPLLPRMINISAKCHYGSRPVYSPCLHQGLQLGCPCCACSCRMRMHTHAHAHARLPTNEDGLTCARVHKCTRARRNADINKDGISTSSHCTKMKLQPLPEVFDVCVYVCARACVSWRASRFSACAPAHTLISRAQLFWFLSPFPYYRNTLSKEKKT